MVKAESTEKTSKAVQLFERGVKAMNRKKYDEARAIFDSIRDKYPADHAVLGRADIHSRACALQMLPPPKKPATADDFYLRAIFHLNNGEAEEALEMLENAQKKETGQPRVEYALALVQARLENRDEALKMLAAAIGHDETCRFVARDDRDFGELREDPEFQALVE